MPQFSFNLIDPAFAQTAGTQSGFDFMGLAPLFVIFIAFYFLLIRPQQKKAQEQREMLNVMTKGDKIVTAGGILGKVHSIDNEIEIVIEVEDGTLIRILKSAVVERVPSGASKKSQVAKDEKSKPANDKKAQKNKTIN